MNTNGKEPTFVIDKCGEEHYSQMRELIRKEYLDREPLIQASGILPIGRQQLDTLVTHKLEEKCVLVAINKINGCVLGVCVSSETTPGCTESVVKMVQPDWHRGIREWIEFQHYVINNPNLWNKYMQHKIWQIELVVTTSSTLNQGIATALVKESLEDADCRCLSLARMFCTHPYAETIGKKLGMKVAKTIIYDEYISNLQFKHLKRPKDFPECKMLIKILNSVCELGRPLHVEPAHKNNNIPKVSKKKDQIKKC